MAWARVSANNAFLWRVMGFRRECNMVVEKASRSRRSIGVGNRRKIHVYICGGVIGVSILKSWLLAGDL